MDTMRAEAFGHRNVSLTAWYAYQPPTPTITTQTMVVTIAVKAVSSQSIPLAPA